MDAPEHGRIELVSDYATEVVPVKGKHDLEVVLGRLKGGEAKCALHPLIHTLLKFNLAQDIEKEKTEPRTPHFLSLNQDIVARSQE